MVIITCPCKYPLWITDKRDNDEIEYIAFPRDYIEDVDGEIDVPEFEEIEEEGFDGKRHKYMAVLFQDPEDAYTKKYDVAEHIVVAGCHVETDGKKMKCKKKELFIVLHPIQEWEEHHMVKIR
ncbi:MAG: hypothetical protein PHP08_00435 [Candidatus Dojkabacteria bacterium]|nr:hypothetical protein [Candidatus Dojkabacteria bacterium]